MNKKIAIAGSTGLIGKALMALFQNSSLVDTINVLVRFISIKPPQKVQEHLVNFDTIKQLPEAEILVICLGTTRRKAGSKEAFRKVDYSYVTHLARLAEKQDYKQIIVISSVGANAASSNFYLKVKGEMEDVIQTINVPSKVIVRPSLLLGKRKEFRLAEKLATIVLQLFMPLLKGKLLKYKPVKDVQVASIIIKSIENPIPGTHIIEPETIHANA